MAKAVRKDALDALAYLYMHTNAVALDSLPNDCAKSPNMSLKEAQNMQFDVDKSRILSTLTKGASRYMAALCRDQIYKAAIDLIDTNLIDIYEYVAPESHESLVGIVGEIAGVVSFTKHLSEKLDESMKRDADMLDQILSKYTEEPTDE